MKRLNGEMPSRHPGPLSLFKNFLFLHCDKLSTGKPQQVVLFVFGAVIAVRTYLVKGFFGFLPFDLLTAELVPDHRSFTENMSDLNGLCDLFLALESCLQVSNSISSCLHVKRPHHQVHT